MITLFFLLGLFIGSFIGVLIERIPKGKNFISNRSTCDYCNHTLSLFDLIPLFSFLILKGKCRYCGKKLSWFYPGIELLTGTLFTFTYLWYIQKFPFIIYHLSFINLFELLFYLYILSSFIVIFFIDLKHKIIPNIILYPTILITILFYLLHPISYTLPPQYLLAALGAFLFFLLLFFVTKGKGMGFGDVQLVFLLGLLLGFPKIILALYLAFLTGALISLILVVGRKYSLKSVVPFGPFLIIGALVALFWGNIILNIFPYL